jgi:hypothetical protein
MAAKLGGTALSQRRSAASLPQQMGLGQSAARIWRLPAVFISATAEHRRTRINRMQATFNKGAGDNSGKINIGEI